MPFHKSLTTLNTCLEAFNDARGNVNFTIFLTQSNAARGSKGIVVQSHKMSTRFVLILHGARNDSHQHRCPAKEARI